MAVFIVFSSFSSSIFPSLMWWVRLTDPRLQTAISSWFVFSVISVHRFEEWTTPVCCCGDLRLQTSLKVIHGCPVSKTMESIFFHSSFASTFLKNSISPVSVWASYSSYLFSKSNPYKSCRSGVSLGVNKVQCLSSDTLFKNKSGTQFAVFISWVLLLSSPVFFLSSTNSSMSTCQVSK